MKTAEKPRWTSRVGPQALVYNGLLNRFGMTAYRTGDRCGWCGKQHFIIGRFSAECATKACGFALALDETAPALPLVTDHDC